MPMKSFLVTLFRKTKMFVRLRVGVCVCVCVQVCGVGELNIERQRMEKRQTIYCVVSVDMKSRPSTCKVQLRVPVREGEREREKERGYIYYDPRHLCCSIGLICMKYLILHTLIQLSSVALGLIKSMIQSLFFIQRTDKSY